MCSVNTPIADLNENTLRNRLQGRLIGDPVWVIPEVASTNSWLKEKVNNQNVPQGALVVADHQTHGRGRIDREWHCPPGIGLLMSLYWTSNLPMPQRPLYSLASALAVFDMLTTDIPGHEKSDRVSFKWPNDILVDGNKISGILSETVPEKGLILGIGINVHQQPEDLPFPFATSIAIWTGQKTNRADILVALTKHLETRLIQIDNNQSNIIIDELMQIGLKIGCDITAVVSDRVLKGTYQGLSPNGALRIQDHQGNIQHLTTVDKLSIGS
jgi:BirA family biotin operon repressor/biotin-[acetyl-CoA-carboxylase] ligase